LSVSDGGLVWFKIFVHLTVLKLVKDVGHYARLDPLLKTFLHLASKTYQIILLSSGYLDR